MLLDIYTPPRRDVLNAASKLLMSARYRARRFRFTDEVVREIAFLMRDYPEILLANYQFALPPYPATYIEYNVRVYLEAMGTPTTVDENPDEIIGYMIDGPVVTVLIQSYDELMGVIPIAYTMVDHRAPKGFVPLQRFGGINVKPIVLVAHMLGSTLQHPRAMVTKERAQDLFQRFKHWVDRDFERKVTDPSANIAKLMRNSTCELRNLLSLLLWLNQPAVANIVAAPASRGFWHGKPRAYHAHHVVELKRGLTRKKILRSFAHRRSPRRHEVAGFWRNFDKHPGCPHAWPIMPDDRERWTCGLCGQWRVRVDAHERGDATVGFVTKEYRATGP